MTEQKVKSGYTKTGFGRLFSCCSRYAFCQLGKGECYYAESDPEVREGCSAWVRNHKAQDDTHELVNTPTKTIIPSGKHPDLDELRSTIKKEVLFQEETLQQLSLFE